MGSRQAGSVAAERYLRPYAAVSHRLLVRWTARGVRDDLQPHASTRPSLQRSPTGKASVYSLLAFEPASDRRVNEIRRNDTETLCAVCGRTLLLGERTVAYERPEGDDARVCELCIDQADSRG